MPDRIYHIPYSNPPITLYLTNMNPPQMSPSIVLLSMIENMQSICRLFVTVFPPAKVFDYGLVRIAFQSLDHQHCARLTYNDVCTTLRGLAEFMVLLDQFYQWTFSIWVQGYAVGGGQISVRPMLPEVSATGVASS